MQGITLTKEAKKAPRELWIVLDEPTAQILNDTVRVRIIGILRTGIPDIISTKERFPEKNEKIIREKAGTRHSLSVSEIVSLSEVDKEKEPLTRNQVYHHIPKLIEGGYIINYGTKTTGKRTTTYYQRTANNIIIASGTQSESHGYHLSTQATKRVEIFLSFF